MPKLNPEALFFALSMTMVLTWLSILLLLLVCCGTWWYVKNSLLLWTIAVACVVVHSSHVLVLYDHLFIYYRSPWIQFDTTTPTINLLLYWCCVWSIQYVVVVVVVVLLLLLFQRMYQWLVQYTSVQFVQAFFFGSGSYLVWYRWPVITPSL
jgi:hypothetical protein